MVVDDGQNQPREQPVRFSDTANEEPSTASHSQAKTEQPTAGELAISRILSSWEAKNYFRHVHSSVLVLHL